jgi:hypothetical protein
MNKSTIVMVIIMDEKFTIHKEKSIFRIRIIKTMNSIQIEKSSNSSLTTLTLTRGVGKLKPTSRTKTIQRITLSVPQ